MPFAYSSFERPASGGRPRITVGIVTQTGIDNDLSGLANALPFIPNINVVNNPITTTAFSAARVTTYQLPINTHLIIEGTLSHNPETEVLLMEGVLRVMPGATYNYGSEVVPTIPSGSTLALPTTNRNTVGCGLIQTGAWNGFNLNRDLSDGDSAPGVAAGSPIGFEVYPNATFNWRGGNIRTAGSVIFAPASGSNRAAQTTINDGEIEMFIGGNFRVENSTGCRVNGLRKTGGFLYLRRGVPAQFEGYVPIHSNNEQNIGGRNPYALLFYGDHINSTQLTALTTPARDFSGIGNALDVAVLDGGHGRLINPEDGINTSIGAWFFTNARGGGRVITNKEYQFNVTDVLSGNPIVGARLEGRDIDNGNRQTNSFGINDSAHVLYNRVGDADGIITTDFESRISTVRSGTLSDDIRCNADGTQEFVISSYNHDPVTVTVATDGIGRLSTNVAMVQDSFVTRQTETSAASISTVSIVNTAAGTTPTINIIGTGATLDDVYDFWKQWSALPENRRQPARLTGSGSALNVADFEFTIQGELSAGDTFTEITSVGDNAAGINLSAWSNAFTSDITLGPGIYDDIPFVIGSDVRINNDDVDAPVTLSLNVAGRPYQLFADTIGTNPVMLRVRGAGIIVTTTIPVEQLANGTAATPPVTGALNAARIDGAGGRVTVSGLESGDTLRVLRNFAQAADGEITASVLGEYSDNSSLEERVIASYTFDTGNPQTITLIRSNSGGRILASEEFVSTFDPVAVNLSVGEVTVAALNGVRDEVTLVDNKTAYLVSNGAAAEANVVADRFVGIKPKAAVYDPAVNYITGIEDDS